MKTIKLLSMILFVSICNAQQYDGKKDLVAALKAAEEGNTDALVYNLRLFSERIDDHNITPEKLPTEHLDLYTQALYTATWKELKIPSELLRRTVIFLNYKIEEKPKNMYSLGYLYNKGLGVTQDYSIAKYWFEKSSSHDNRAAKRSLAHLYLDGHGVIQDYNKAFGLYKTAAEMGDANAMSNLAWMYEKGYGTSKDMNIAVLWYKKAIEENNDDGYSMNSLGNYYYNEEKNYSLAEKYYKQGCECKFSWACSNLGGKFQYIDKNYESSVSFYKKAIEIEDNDRAYYELGRIYYFNLDGENYSNNEYAKSMFMKVSKEYERYSYALTFIGEIYKKEYDYSSAIFYFNNAAILGLPRALNHMGVMYHNGTGVNEDFTTAYGYYLWALAMGDKDNALSNIKILQEKGLYIQNQQDVIENLVNACFGFKQNFITEGEILYNLAIMLKTGSALKKSSKDAQYWFQKSCEKGYTEACKNLK